MPGGVMSATFAPQLSHGRGCMFSTWSTIPRALRSNTMRVSGGPDGD